MPGATIGGGSTSAVSTETGSAATLVSKFTALIDAGLQDGSLVLVPAPASGVVTAPAAASGVLVVPSPLGAVVIASAPTSGGGSVAGGGRLEPDPAR